MAEGTATTAEGMLTRTRTRVGRASVVAACALASTACGGKQKVDAGGFTTAEQKAVQTALRILQQTPIPRTVVAISRQSGQAPTICQVLPKTDAGGTFELVVGWKPDHPAYMSVPQSVLEATIGKSVKDDRFHVSSFGGGGHDPIPEPASVEASLVRAVLSKPAEKCEVLENSQLRLASPR